MSTKRNKATILENIKRILSKWGFSKKGLSRNTKGEWYLSAQLIIVILHLLPSCPKIEYIIFPLNIIFMIAGIIF